MYMNNKLKIQAILGKKGKITTAEICKSLGVSRQYAYVVMNELVAEDKAIKLGSTRSSYYVTPEFAQEHPEIFPSVLLRKYRNTQLEEHVVLAEIEEKLPSIILVKENVRSIFTFAFSEMLNNAIEHSSSKNISVEVALQNNKLSFVIDDAGVGVFRNIMNKKKLRSETEAIQDLLKGKTTTMPKSHSGEGIFFTSKASNLFILNSYGYELTIQPQTRGVLMKRIPAIKRGTRVIWEISANSELHLNDVFRKYTNLKEKGNFGFDKTEIRVRLYTTGGVHISRSQARRILSGLDKFGIIVLDFDKVPVVGQAFADEIYRVFQNAHPDIVIQEEHMTPGVQFMIERSKNEARKFKKK